MPDDNDCFDPGLLELFEDSDVLDSVSIAEYLGVETAWAREWAGSAGVPRISNGFAWTLPRAQEFADAVDEELGDEADEGENEAEDEDDDQEND